MSVAIAAAPELVGSPTPRIFTPPLRPLTPDTSLGFEAIEFAEQVLGLELLPWQRNFLIAALELRPDGTFRFRTVVLLVGRQSGKSTVAQVLTLWRMCMDGARTVLATAQNLDVSNRTVADVQEIVQGNPELAPMFDKDGRAGGKFWFRLKGDQGETYEMRAVTADRRGARSMTADLVFADELREHTDWEAWNAVEATISTRSRGMILVTSNAGDGRSVVLKALREQGLQAIRDNNHDTKLGLFEWSAPDDCDMHDPRGWVQALPGLGITSLVEDVQSAASRPGNEWGFRALAVDTPILTSAGWSTMGEVQVGDQVKGLDGQWVTVTGCSEVYRGRSYRVTLNDRRSIVCDEGHLWTVRDRRRPSHGYATTTTAEMVRRGITYYHPSMKTDVRNFMLPKPGIQDGPDVDLPIHPYALGLWLGDGNERCANIFIEDRDRDHVVAQLAALGVDVVRDVKDSEHCHRLSLMIDGRRGAFVRALRRLGVFQNKHIPDLYFTASAEQRLWLLRGLIDSDGTVSTTETVFVNTNRELASGTANLVRSLGWKTTLRSGHYGEAHHLTRLSLGFTVRPGDPAPASIPRKIRYVPQGHNTVRGVTITSIEPVGERDVRCIEVDAPDSLYLAGDFVPTHNTERLCQWRTAAKDAPFSDEEIAACIDDASEIAQDSPIVLAADVAQDRSKTVLAVAGWRTDGLPHVEVIVERAGTEWLPKVLSTELEFDPDLTVMQGRGAPISSIVDLIAAEGVEVTSCQGMESTTACARFSDRLKAGRLRFRDDSSLMLALTEAVKKSVGDAWEWSRKASPVDVSSLVAVTEALWGLEQLELAPAKAPAVTAYGDDYDDWWK